MKLFDLKEAADRLGTSVDHVRALIDDGRLQYVNIGRGRKRPRYRFTDADLNEFIEANRAREEAPCPSSRSRRVRTTNSTSCSVAIGFTAQRNARSAKKPKKWRP
ncbi:helix-turn-helix domain-containing protein [Bradyrhizobium sp. SZCCHNS30582]|uniref:helix-turn-helix domain-containing protein n=1 Tax=unclassified Bradyrhizobium TaxID=2631580 RepID=UPI003966B63E